MLQQTVETYIIGYFIIKTNNFDILLNMYYQNVLSVYVYKKEKKRKRLKQKVLFQKC